MNKSFVSSLVALIWTIACCTFTASAQESAHYRPIEDDYIVLNRKIVIAGFRNKLGCEPNFIPTVENGKFSIEGEVELFTDFGYTKLSRIELHKLDPTPGLQSNPNVCWQITNYNDLNRKASQDKSRLYDLYPTDRPTTRADQDSTDESVYIYLNGTLVYLYNSSSEFYETKSDTKVSVLHNSERFARLLRKCKFFKRGDLPNGLIGPEGRAHALPLVGEICIMSRLHGVVLPALVLDQDPLDARRATIRLDSIPTIVSVAEQQNLVPRYLKRYYDRLPIRANELNSENEPPFEWMLQSE